MTPASEAQMTEAPEWRVATEFRHKGVIVSPGDPVPDLDEATRSHLFEHGYLARRGPDGWVYQEAPEPQTAENYMMTGDPDIIRRIRKYRPSLKMIREILALADETGRTRNNPTLGEALRLAARAKVED